VPEDKSGLQHGTVLPLYMVVDSSASMGLLLMDVHESLAHILDILHGDPLLGDLIRLSIISYSDTAHVELPLTAANDIDAAPVLKAKSGTMFGPAFATVRECIQGDVALLKAEGVRVLRPAVLFMTDGWPSDLVNDWEHKLDDLKSGKLAPTLISLGLTGNEDPRALQRIASRPEFAFYAKAGASLSATITDLVGALTTSVTSSVVGGQRAVDLVVPSTVQRIPDFGARGG
jgi:uncharacterized protein YegL